MFRLALICLGLHGQVSFLPGVMPHGMKGGDVDQSRSGWSGIKAWHDLFLRVFQGSIIHA